MYTARKPVGRWQVGQAVSAGRTSPAQASRHPALTVIDPGRTTINLKVFRSIFLPSIPAARRYLSAGIEGEPLAGADPRERTRRLPSKWRAEQPPWRSTAPDQGR